MILPTSNYRRSYVKVKPRRNLHHMLHGAGIFTDICPQPITQMSVNKCKYTIHGAYGFGNGLYNPFMMI